MHVPGDRPSAIECNLWLGLSCGILGEGAGVRGGGWGGRRGGLFFFFFQL